MSGSCKNQVAKALEVLFMDKPAQDAFKAKHGVVSVKKALRPDGDPTKPLPLILSYQTQRGYFGMASAFFKCARRFSNSPHLADWFDPEIIRSTLDKHYRDLDPDTLNTLFPALYKVWQGCVRLGWIPGNAPCPITDDLRAFAKAFRDDGDVRLPRYGYAEGRGTDCGPPVRVQIKIRAGSGDCLALRAAPARDCRAAWRTHRPNPRHPACRPGQRRPGARCAYPADLIEKLNLSQDYLFAPKESWKHAFDRAVRRAARTLGITISGIHRMRSNCFQSLYRELIAAGKTDAEARDQVSKMAGHRRRDVVASYIPSGLHLSLGDDELA